ARYALGRLRGSITSETHRGLKPVFSDSPDDAKTAAKEAILKRLSFVAARLKTEYLFGGRMSVADAYLFVMLLWARNNKMALPKPLADFAARIAARPATKK